MASIYRKDDRGFSLVELIVVILIMGVLAGGGIAAVNSIYHANAERAAKKLCNLMDIARSKAMALNNDDPTNIVDIKLKIYTDTDGTNYAGVYQGDTLIEPASPEKLSNYKVTIKAGKKNSAEADRITISTTPLEYSFKKSSGGIKSVKLGTDVTTNEDDEKFYADIIVEGASTYKIIVVPATGRCYANEE